MYACPAAHAPGKIQGSALYGCWARVMPPAPMQEAPQAQPPTRLPQAAATARAVLAPLCVVVATGAALSLATGITCATSASLPCCPQDVFRVAMSLHRTVVWPWVPCEAPLLRATDARHDPATHGHRLPFDDYVNITRAIPYGLGAASLKVRYGS